MMKRRDLLKIAGMSSLAVNFPAPAFGQSSTQQLSTTALGNNLSLISGAGCNVVVAVGPESVVVVDGGRQENAQALLAEINKIAQGKPISTLFNTNWRREHTGLNYLLGDADIIAHENTRLWQGADFYVDWEDANYQAMPVGAQANKTFYKTGSLNLGGETINYGYLSQAHTDGDIYIHFTQADVLVVSDLLGVDAYPVLDYVTGGWVGGMQTATQQLLELSNAETRIIAAEGGVLSRENLQAQGAMLDKAYEGVSTAFLTGRSLAQFQEVEPMAEYVARWGEPTQFVKLLYTGTWYHIPSRAVRGTI